MSFQWDAAKAAFNLKRHDVPFEEALTVFYDPLAATFGDPERSHGEQRPITVRYSARGRLLVVCHTERARSLRLISARPATKHERKRHESQEPT